MPRNRDLEDALPIIGADVGRVSALGQIEASIEPTADTLRSAEAVVLSRGSGITLRTLGASQYGRPITKPEISRECRRARMDEPSEESPGITRNTEGDPPGQIGLEQGADFSRRQALCCLGDEAGMTTQIERCGKISTDICQTIDQPGCDFGE